MNLNTINIVAPDTRLIPEGERTKPESKHTIEREKIPPSNGKDTPLQVNLQDVKDETKKLNFKLIIPQTYLDIIQKVAEIKNSQFNHIIDAIAYYIHTEFCKFTDINTNIKFISDEQTSVISKEIYLICYISLSTVILEHVKNRTSFDFSPYTSLKKYFPSFQTHFDFLKKLIGNHQKKINSNEEFMIYFNKLKGLSKEELNSKIQFYSKNRVEASGNLINILNGFSFIEEIFSMPNKKSMNDIIDNLIYQKLKWPKNYKDSSFIKERLASYNNFVLKIFDVAHTCIGVQIINPTLVNTVFEHYEELSKCKFVDDPSSIEKSTFIKNTVEYLDQLTVSESTNFTKVLRIKNYETYKKKNNIEKNQTEFAAYQLQRYVAITAMVDTFSHGHNSFANEIFAYSPSTSLKIDILHQFYFHQVYKKVLNSSLASISDFAENFIDIIKINSLQTFNEFIHKIIKIEKIISDNKSGLIEILKNLTDSTNLECVTYLAYKSVFKTINNEIAECKQLMYACNKSIQEAVDATDCEIVKLQCLDEILKEIKAGFSVFLNPTFRMPDLVNNLLTLRNETTPVDEIVNDINLSDEIDVIPDLFHVNFEKAYLKRAVPIKIEFLEPVNSPVPMPEPLPKIEPEVRQPALKSQEVKTLTVPKLKPILVKTSLDEEELPNTKLKTMLNYLVERGWKVKSINGSHLKLKRNNQSLIVPINKSHLADGTFHAIKNQEKEKRNASGPK